MKDLGRVSVSVFCFIVLVSLLAGIVPGFSFSSTAQALFADGGLILTDFNNDDDAGHDLVQQTDGKVIAVGFGNNGAVKNIAVVRYLDSGALDTSFSNDGRASFSQGNGDSIARAVTLQDDGSILVAGTMENDDQDLFVLRLTSDGELDNTFGSNGVQTLTRQGSAEHVRAIAVAADGSITLAGYAESSDAPSAGIVVRLSSDGSVQREFGVDGWVMVDREYDTFFYSLILLADNEILTTGARSSNGQYEAYLVKLEADGSLDEEFADSGELSFAYEQNNTRMFDLAELSDGSIVTLGYAYVENLREPLIARVSADGELVGNFGDGGFVLSQLAKDVVTSTFVQQDDLTITSSLTQAPSGDDLVIIKVDEALAEADSATTSYLSLFSDDYDSDSLSTVVSDEGTVIVAGVASNGLNDDVAVQDYGENLTPSPLIVAAGVVSNNYKITTFPVTDIQRNSATSGGSIVALKTEDDCIETTCNSLCDDDLLGTSSCDNCLEVCTPPSVVLRGVAYGITPNPSYRDSDDSDDDLSDSDDDEESSSVFPASDSPWNYEEIRTGQTEDGSGLGEFGSDMYPITPGVRYYARAYAVLADDTVIHGNQVLFKTDDTCFIATAAFGSINNKHVVLLRKFRDEVLHSHELGKKFVEMYYRFSPAIANKINENNILKSLVRVALMPIIGFCYLVLKGGVWMLALLLSVLTVVCMMLVRKRERRRI